MVRYYHRCDVERILIAVAKFTARCSNNSRAMFTAMGYAIARWRSWLFVAMYSVTRECDVENFVELCIRSSRSILLNKQCTGVPSKELGRAKN